MADNPIYALWQRGLKGPQLTILHMRGRPPRLDDCERRHKVAEPVLIDAKDAGAALEEIARLYALPPGNGEEL